MLFQFRLFSVAQRVLSAGEFYDRRPTDVTLDANALDYPEVLDELVWDIQRPQKPFALRVPLATSPRYVDALVERDRYFTPWRRSSVHALNKM